MPSRSAMRIRGALFAPDAKTCARTLRHAMNPLLPKDGLRACPLSRLLAAGLALGSVLALPARAAQLGIADGVVVKFGPDTQLVVRDRMVFGSGITLTSQGDDQAGAPTPTAAAPFTTPRGPARTP